MIPHPRPASEWAVALAPNRQWREVYTLVESEVRALLTYRRTEAMSTAELVGHLFPAASALEPEHLKARKRLFQAVGTLATRALGDCCHRGPSKPVRFGRVIKPWVWHEPCGQLNPEAHENRVRLLPALTHCPHCGELLHSPVEKAA